VSADVALPVGARVAVERLTQAFHGGGRTGDDDGAVLMVVGPGRRTHLVGKQVRVTLTRRGHAGSTEVFDLHWEPVGPAASAYPPLDAVVGITPVAATSSLLSIVASYRPPLGPVGATLDRAAMSRVAEATITSVLHRLAAAVTKPTRPIAIRSPGARPVVRSVT
jgi:hypothetical protein